MEISVVVPIYNKANYLEPCLRSLLTQAFSDFEVVCIDDGSTDGSAQQLDRLAATDTRIVAIHQPNGGVTAARRTGVEHARGRYIMFVDADDSLLPDALATMHKAIEESGADEVIAPYRTMQGEKSPVIYRGVTPADPLIRYIVTSKNRFPVLWSIIFRRHLLLDVLDTPREIIEGEDKLMQVKVLMKQPRVFFITSYIYNYNGGLPNNRRRTLVHEQLYDELLAEVLQPRKEEFGVAYALHQLKEYERFIRDGVFSVKDAYYAKVLTPLPAGIPLYDRLVFMLPPRWAQPVVRFYRRLFRMKQLLTGSSSE